MPASFQAFPSTAPPSQLQIAGKRVSFQAGKLTSQQAGKPVSKNRE
jgi:hypothetical protein